MTKCQWYTAANKVIVDKVTLGSVAAKNKSASPAPTRLNRWRIGTFGPASEKPYRRLTRDYLRVLISVLIVLYLCDNVNTVSDLSKNIYKTINGMPDGMESFFILAFGFGSLWALALIGSAALIARRGRLARDLVVAGALAWILGRLIGVLAVQGAPFDKSLDAVIRIGDGTPSFPYVPLAVAVAIISAAMPYLARPTRRLGHFFIVMMAFAGLYLGVALPAGIIAGLFLGWGIAALVHLVFGSPSGRPTRKQVGATLLELGVDAQNIELALPQPAHGTIMTATDKSGAVVMRILGRDEADAQVVNKFWQTFLYKNGGNNLYLTRLQDVEHEAYVLLLAARSGVRSPSVVVAGMAGPGTALLVQRPLPGVCLADTTAKSITSVVLGEAWREVRRLHASHISHGHLNANHIILGTDGPGIVDFSHATTAATVQARAADVAELLASSAQLVGAKRAVACARRGIGTQAVIDSLPLLQPAALSSEMRPHHRKERSDFKNFLSSLREEIASSTGTEEPQLQQLYRFDITQILMAVGTLFAIFALLSQISDPEKFWQAIKSASWLWLSVALIISFLTNFATAVSLMGTVPIPLPLMRTAELQLSLSFSNLAVPAVGGMAAQIRFLQKQGIDLASAVASGGLLANVGNVFACGLLLIVALVLSPTPIQTGEISIGSEIPILLIALFIGFVLSAIFFGIPRIRKRIMPPIKSAVSTMREALSSPRRIFYLLAGSMVNALMYAAVLNACLAAMGGSLNFWTVLAINLFVGTIASLVPVPGGGTAVYALGLTGGLTLCGVPTDIAVAAVLMDQLVTSFIPAVPGWFATNDLLHDGYL